MNSDSLINKISREASNNNAKKKASKRHDPDGSTTKMLNGGKGSKNSFRKIDGVLRRSIFLHFLERDNKWKGLDNGLQLKRN
jgi:hypothetical protein